MSPTIREAQNAGAFLLADCAIFVPYFPAIREHYIIFYYIIICKKTPLCQLPASPPKKEQRRLFLFFYSEAGILHGKSRAVDLQGRMRQERRWFSAVFC